MKKIQLLLVILVIINNPIFSSLIDYYKKGTIKLEQTSNFGKDVDWESIFYQANKDLLVVEDGTIFVCPGFKHNIFKFDVQGHHIATYGQKGEGKGDLYYPGDLSVLDGKYLVIGEYGTLRRLSIFDFQGACRSIVRTNHSPSFPVALKDNKIAYLYEDTSMLRRANKIKDILYIKDIISGTEFPVISWEFTNKNHVLIGGTLNSITDNNEFGEMFFQRTGDGNLLVGISSTPDIRIFSTTGKLLRTFKLQMNPIPVTETYVEQFKALFIENLKAEIPPNPHSFIKAYEKLPFKDFFPGTFPYYREILVDGEGNILVFKTSTCITDCHVVFQVYTPAGQFVCETILDKGRYDFTIDRRYKNIAFTKKAIYGLFQLKGTEDISLRLVKIEVH